MRSAVHEYGGGSYCVFKDGLIYTDFPSHIVFWKQAGSDEVTQIFPAVGSKSKCRFADFSVIEQEGGGSVLLAVMEDHSDPKPIAVENSIVTVSLDGMGAVQILASGHDFYTSPCYEATSHKVAYVAWDHPNMPWDSTTLYVKDLHGTSAPLAVVQNASIYAPQWYEGKLYFLSNATGWYNLYCWDGPETTVRALLPIDADFSAFACGWILGIKCFTFLNGTIIAAYKPHDEDVGFKVVQIDTKNGSVQEYGRSSLPPTSISSLTASGDALYFLGGSTTMPMGVWCWERPGDTNCVAVQVLPSMQGNDLLTIQPFLSEPRYIKFPSDSLLGLGFAYGYYYPPVQQSATKPPLLVKAHGGPTSSTSTTFRIDIQFWTSRGFAVLDVDYGGSTGYGKDFQQSLRGKWGLLDVADVCHGAKYCVEQGWANPDHLCIDGQSAGGYTTLAALAFSDTFRAGASLYGVGDLKALAEDTHKFESRYLDGLIGPYPEERILYEERCPVKHPDKFNSPVILLQGDEDKVVPPEQAEAMFKALITKGIRSALVIYKGEQHGFRKSENIRHALLSEYFFFCEIFGFQPQPEDNFYGVAVGTRVEV